LRARWRTALALALLRDRPRAASSPSSFSSAARPELLDRGVDRQRAQRVGVVELRHRRLPHLGRGRGLGQLDQRLGVAHRGGGLLAQPVIGGAQGDLDQRAIVAQLEQAGQRVSGEGVVLVLAGGLHPQLGGAAAGEVAVGAIALALGELGEQLDAFELLDGDPAYPGILVGLGDGGEDVGFVGRQGADSLEAHLDVAVSIFGTEKISQTHSRRNLPGSQKSTRFAVRSRP
jgi:hypothetical protein